MIVQHLTLWVAFLGAALAASSDRLLSIFGEYLLCRTNGPGPCASWVAASPRPPRPSLAWASYLFVASQREGGGDLGLGIAKWVAQLVMPFGFLVITGARHPRAGERPVHKLTAALFLLIPLAMLLAPQPQGSTFLWIGIPIIVAGSLLGMPIFATLGGIALLLFWNAGLPGGASVPVETYRLVASPVLPSLPLFTLAGYILVEGGASVRLLRVYTALFGLAAGRTGHYHRGGLRHLHLGRFRRDHSLHGRSVAADAGEGALPGAVFHRAH